MKSSGLVFIGILMVLGTFLSALALPTNCTDTNDQCAKKSQYYIVKLKPGVALTHYLNELKKEMIKWNENGSKNKLKAEYHFKSFTGFSGKFEPQLVEKIKLNQNVSSVELDKPVYTNAIQKNAPWTLAKISKNLPYVAEENIYLPPSAGRNSTVYVVDTGINVNLTEFDDRAKWGKTFCEGCPDEDDNGHGTNVAAIIAAKGQGVAEMAKLIAVKSLNHKGYGFASDLISAFEWILEDKKEKKLRHAVVNVSMGAYESGAFNYIIPELAENGIALVSTAGNESRDASISSLNTVDITMVVAAANKSLRFAWFSNFGPHIDLIAPGDDLIMELSTGTKWISGTSYAAPHVAGAMALIFTLYPHLSPREVHDYIKQLSSKLIVEKVPKDTNNAFLNLSRDFFQQLNELVSKKRKND